MHKSCNLLLQMTESLRIKYATITEQNIPQHYYLLDTLVQLINWLLLITEGPFFYGTGISPRLVQKGICLEGASNKGLFHTMLLYVYPISFHCWLFLLVAWPCCSLGNEPEQFKCSFLISFTLFLFLSFLYCSYLFIVSLLDVLFPCYYLCALQSEEAMLSAMVEVADALVTDMFQAKTCYRKIFSV